MTLFMALLAAFQTLLMRYTDQEDIIIGTPVAGRNRLETETLIGLFINTLVMRTDLSGNPTFRDLLSRVRNVVLTAFEHQNLPFGKLVAELQPERDLSHPPVFQVMFVLQNAPTLAVCLPGLVLAPVNFDNGVSKLDLTLESMETDDGLTCCFEYNTDLFEFATIERMAIGFRAILEGLLENPERRIWGFSLLGPAECRTLTHNWNETRAEYPDVPVYRLIEERAMQVPDQVALVFEGQQLTYAELNRSANQLAHYLRGRGVQPGSLVGICVERSLEMVIGLLGIMKAGAAYAPFDPGFPQERLAFMIEDSQVPLVLTQEHLARVLQESATQVVCLDRDWKEIAGCAGENSTEGATLEDLAYVIYTSGSTGKPKGVQISHRAVVNFLTSMRRDPGMVQEDVLVAVTTLSFDIAGLELYLPLMVGAREIAFPRLNAYSYWLLLFGGLMLVIAFLLNIGPDVGWFAYVPLSGPQYSPGKRADFWAQMITFSEVSALAVAVQLIVTIFKMRAPGMSINRIPLFVWAQLVTSFMVIFAMPAVMLASSALISDRLVATHFFNPAEGRSGVRDKVMFHYGGGPAT